MFFIYVQGFYSLHHSVLDKNASPDIFNREEATFTVSNDDILVTIFVTKSNICLE